MYQTRGEAFQIGGYLAFFAHRKPKLEFFTCGSKKERLKLGAEIPH